jgi:hypothetical protein
LSAWQIASSVEKRIARALPVLRMLRLASVMSNLFGQLGQRQFAAGEAARPV